MGFLIKGQSLIVNAFKNQEELKLPVGANLTDTDDILINFILI